MTTQDTCPCCAARARAETAARVATNRIADLEAVLKIERERTAQARRWARAWKRMAKTSAERYRFIHEYAHGAIGRQRRRVEAAAADLTTERAAHEDTKRALALLKEQLAQTYEHWRDARGAEMLLVRNDLEETRRINRRLLEDYHTESARRSQAEAECAAALDRVATLERQLGATHERIAELESVSLPNQLEETREALAAYAHQALGEYLLYMFGKCTVDASGNLVIPAAYYQNIVIQCNTPYADLTPAEQDMDREQADRMLAIVAAPAALLAAARAVCASKAAYTDAVLLVDAALLRVLERATNNQE